jgi:hypothetical protein
VKHIHSRDTLRNPLNIDFGIQNERRDCKIGNSVGRWVNGDEDDGIWLMGFIYMYKIEQ